MNSADEHLYLQLFADCIAVKGSVRSIIYDLGRCSYKIVPNDLLKVLQRCSLKSLSEVIADLDAKDKKTAKEYVNFLIKNELGFLCTKNEKEMFPKLPLNWDVPSTIANATIEVDNRNFKNLHHYILELQKFNCYFFSLNFHNDISTAAFIETINSFRNSDLYSLSIAIPHTILSDKIINEITKLHYILNVVCYNAPADDVLRYSNDGRIKLITKALTKKLPATHIPSFTVNISHFTEAQKFNTFYNRKIYIDRYGNVRNSVFAQKHGKLNKNETHQHIKRIINSKAYNYLYNVKKDIVKTCKDCEYRYMCTDPRIPMKSSSGYYYYETPCSYNPYKGEWKS
jgi:SPASM domain peptide maturase of grasp-with-spasm system